MRRPCCFFWARFGDFVAHSDRFCHLAVRRPKFSKNLSPHRRQMVSKIGCFLSPRRNRQSLYTVFSMPFGGPLLQPLIYPNVKTVSIYNPRWLLEPFILTCIWDELKITCVFFVFGVTEGIKNVSKRKNAKSSPNKNWYAAVQHDDSAEHLHLYRCVC